ncbi:SAF domain-containing protein [Streptomyces roseus]|uniref:SAF domain-containing protein n=1 Tax=Streptomyces roseus TaxID=66430 RepID=UPI00380B08D3
MSTSIQPSASRTVLPGPAGSQTASAATPRVMRQRRRRPGLIALSIALIAAGGLSGALLFTASGQRSSVLVVVRDVPVGQAISSADLAPASIALDPAVKAVPVGKKAGLVGQRAAVALKSGSLLSPGQVTSASLVKAGEQLVGVALKPSQLPASRLAPGQKVLIVSTPDPAPAGAAAGSGKPADATAPATLAATVVAVGVAVPATGVVVVDVAVPSASGPTLAARVATGAIALIVAAQEGGS